MTKVLGASRDVGLMYIISNRGVCVVKIAWKISRHFVGLIISSCMIIIEFRGPLRPWQSLASHLIKLSNRGFGDDRASFRQRNETTAPENSFHKYSKQGFEFFLRPRAVQRPLQNSKSSRYGFVRG